MPNGGASRPSMPHSKFGFVAVATVLGLSCFHSPIPPYHGQQKEVTKIPAIQYTMCKVSATVALGLKQLLALLLITFLLVLRRFLGNSWPLSNSPSLRHFNWGIPT